MSFAGSVSARKTPFVSLRMDLELDWSDVGFNNCQRAACLLQCVSIHVLLLIHRQSSKHPSYPQRRVPRTSKYPPPPPRPSRPSYRRLHLSRSRLLYRAPSLFPVARPSVLRSSLQPRLSLRRSQHDNGEATYVIRQSATWEFI